MFNSIKYFFQRLFRGWDDRETWNLDLSFYKWLLTRLTKFRQLTTTCPMNRTWKEWYEEIDLILYRLRLITKEDNYFSDDATANRIKREILEWFNNNIKNLWY